MGDSILSETDTQTKVCKPKQLLKDLLCKLANSKMKIKTLKRIIIICCIIIMLGILSGIALCVYNIIY